VPSKPRASASCPLAPSAIRVSAGSVRKSGSTIRPSIRLGRRNHRASAGPSSSSWPEAAARAVSAGARLSDRRERRGRARPSLPGGGSRLARAARESPADGRAARTSPAGRRSSPRPPPSDRCRRSDGSPPAHSRARRSGRRRGATISRCLRVGLSSRPSRSTGRAARRSNREPSRSPRDSRHHGEGYSLSQPRFIVNRSEGERNRLAKRRMLGL
jgi:hypothetical protein